MITKQAVLEALKGVVDPELGLNIVDLGLVYGVEVDEDRVLVRMTLTTPGCPLGSLIAEQARKALDALAGVKEAKLELVWDPPWTPERMSEAARRRLGL
jgi:metal-sulfur cluster biosynthetic enzyme